MAFADTEMNVSTRTVSESYRSITENGMDISHFFERPINIQTYEWDDETSFFEVVSPWYDYFKNTTIRQKLRGFSRMTCEGLELEFRVNGSPFRYSSVLASYRPLFCYVKRLAIVGELSTAYYGIPNAEFSGGHIWQDGVEDPGTQKDILANETPIGCTLGSLICRSQRQHVYLDVASSSGGKMVLPFIYPKEAIELDYTDAQGNFLEDYMIFSYFMRTLRGLGTLHMESLAPLRTLQAATTAGCTIQLYAKPVGVKAWMASGNAAYSVQGLTSTISSMWSSVVRTAPVAATTQQIDRATEGDGHMPTIMELAKKKAIVALFDWSTTNPTGLGLLGLPIHPVHRVRTSRTSPTDIPSRVYNMTPACFAALNYRMWRGTARVTLKAMASTFHRGRLRVAWDPQVVTCSSTTMQSENGLKPVDPHSQCFIWDLASSSQVTFDIGFASSMSKLSVPPLNCVGGATGNYSYVTNAGGYLPLSDFSLDNMRDYFNGILMVYVENVLQAPVASIVTIAVEMSFPDLQLYDTTSQTCTMDMMSSSSATYGCNYSTNVYAENQVYDESYAVIPNASTRGHAIDEYIPQGVGTVPNTLDKEEKIDFVFQPPTSVPNFDNSTREDLHSLVVRELTYDTHTFEVPLMQEYGSGTVANNKKATGFYYPPYLIKAMMPAIPGNFGTTSPCRGVSYDLDRDSGGKYAYAVTMDSVERDLVPNLARTHFAMILKECYVGYRSTFRWRFTSLGNNGVDIEYMAVERSNAMLNNTSGTTGRSGSYPVDRLNAPYALYPNLVSDSSFPSMAYPNNVFIRPLMFNQGSTVTQLSSDLDYPAWVSRSGLTGSKFGVNTIMELRKRVNAFVGSFYTGGVFCHGSVNSVETQIPYFAKTRFLPSSCLAWAFSDSNQESTTQMVLTVLSKSKSSGVTSTGLDNAGNVGEAWSIYSNFPKRATLNVVSSVSPGEDFEVYYFTNIPSIHLLTSDPYLTEAAIA